MDPFVAVLLRQSPAGALVGLVVLAVLAVWRGWLVPRSHVRDLLGLHEQRQVESRDREVEWRRAWEVSEAARAITAASTADLLEAMRTLEALVRALPPASSRRGDR